MHLLLILVIVLIIFGPGKLPALGESLGKSIRGFKKAMADKEEDKVEASKMEEKKP
jgi:sec-independent protein translocase protein TatA